MKVAWLADAGNLDGTGVGGAELTQAEFRAAKPKDVRVIGVGPGTLDRIEECDVVCCFNVALYPPETKQALSGKRIVRYWSDVAPHGDHKLTRWFLANATNVFCSPLHYDRFPWRNGADVDHHVIPPAVPLQRFRDAAERSQERSGAVSIAPWRGWGKSPQLAQEWARGNGSIDFFGGGQLAPEGSVHVSYDEMPDLLARYETFVYLPTALEPFCRVVVEAWAAGCAIVTNRLVGARYFLEEAPEKLETAAEDFWSLATSG